MTQDSYRPLSALRIWDDNYNRGDVEGIARSIRRYGFNNAPRVWREGQVRGGNHSVLALRLVKAQGPRPEIDLAWPPANVVVRDDDWYVECVDIAHLSPLEATAFAIADNEYARRASIEHEKLLAHLDEIRIDPTLIAATGLNDQAIDDLRRLVDQAADAQRAQQTPGETSQRRAAELLAAFPVQPGDVWSVAGKHGQTHRLICADATEPAAYARLLGRDRVTLTFTSPPYNAGTSETLSNNSHTTDSKYVLGAGDDLNVSDYLGLLSAFTQCALDVSDWALVNLQMLAGNKIALVEYLFAFRHRLADIAIWDKGASQPAMAERVMNSDYEYLLMFSRREHPSRAFGNKPFRGTVSNVVDIAPQRHNPYPELIAATMPDELPVWALSTFTSPGDGILDPFAGSGTTIVACEQMGRTGYGIELVPAHLAATLDRLSQLGLEPIREDSA